MKVKARIGAERSGQESQQVTENEILRRMLNTPPQPRKKNEAKKPRKDNKKSKANL